MIKKAQVILDAAVVRSNTFFDRGPTRRGLYSLYQGMKQHGVGRAASAMAFDLFLAMVPMVALAGWTLSSVLKSDQSVLGLTSTLLDLTPYQVHLVVRRHFGRFSAGMAPVAVMGALWLASSAFHTAMAVFEVALGVERRPYWKKRVIALCCVVVGIVAFGVAGSLAVILAGGPRRILLHLSAGSDTVASSGHYVLFAVSILTVTALLAAFFRVAVHREGVRRRVWWGAIATVAVGMSASAAFAFYARTLARFTLFYGSLAAVAILLAWLWLWCVAMLIGVELNAQLESADRRRFPRNVTPVRQPAKVEAKEDESAEAAAAQEGETSS